MDNRRDISELDKVLQMFNLREVKPYLTKAQITYESLRYLSKDDIKEAIPPIGLRARFREKLFTWRNNQVFRTDDEDTLSDAIASKVISWLQNNTNNIGLTSRPTSSVSVAPEGCKLSKKLPQVLQNSTKGKSIQAFYDTNGYLIDTLRGDMINIILQDIFDRNVTLTPKEFSLIIDEIHENFPNEIKEYYFIPRGKRKNPGGKLWDKYTNQRAKRAKTCVDLKDIMVEERSVTSPAASSLEIHDESTLISLKALLSQETFSNWEEVKDKWQQTFSLRQKELKNAITDCKFLQDWPLFSNPRSHELINIDFELLYPNKSQLLFTKWNDFSKNIAKYYLSHMKDKKSKELLANIVNITDKNSLDYINTILLNSVILPSARFIDKYTKASRKLTISDANNSFVVYLRTINDYEIIISELRKAYYNESLTVQPIIIVVGQSEFSLEQFYVYFDKKLLKFDSFLKSFDVCFKIFHALSLDYPKGCQGPWLFIQEYFYEIILPTDGIKKSPSICALLNFLNIINSN